MVGQEKLKSHIRDLIENDKFPRFVILAGLRGSGKKLMTQYIAEQLTATRYEAPISVDGIRTMIDTAYKVTSPIVFVIADGDKMSPAAKNALLKVTEEPPQLAYFILTLQSEYNTLDTIRSRAVVFHMDYYSSKEIEEYTRSKHNLSEDEVAVISSLCDSPGEVDEVIRYGTPEFRNYVEKVVDNIAEVSDANAFKIGDKLALKSGDSEKFSLRLFWKAFMWVCSLRMPEDIARYSIGIVTTYNYLADLYITGINMQSTFDMWVLDIRDKWGTESGQ